MTPSNFRISPRKLILSLLLAASIVFFFLILVAGGVALLREAAPTGHSGIIRMLHAVHRMITHHNTSHHSK